MTTTSLLVADVDRNPELFELRIPVSEAELDDVEEELGGRLPPSYRAVLRRFGQGLMYDSESLLGVHEIDEGLGDLVEVNRRLREDQGLAPQLLVFHLGSGGLHAFDTQTAGPEHGVVALDEDTLERGRTFDDFDSWYVEFLREQYAQLLDLDD